MKIAFIMLCHKNPNQINSLIEKLSSDGIDFYLHIDINSNIRNKIIKKNNVHILPPGDSFSIKWGGIDMVLATLSLLRKVKKTAIKYDYIWLISGQDFPLVTISQIKLY